MLEKFWLKIIELWSNFETFAKDLSLPSSVSSNASSSIIVEIPAKVDKSFSDELDEELPELPFPVMAPPEIGDFGLSKAVQFNWTMDLHLSWHVKLQLAHFMAPVS